MPACGSPVMIALLSCLQRSEPIRSDRGSQRAPQTHRLRLKEDPPYLYFRSWVVLTDKFAGFVIVSGSSQQKIKEENGERRQGAGCRYHPHPRLPDEDP